MLENHSQAEFPEKLSCLFEKARYKVLWGGRGGAKSWGVARALLIQGAAKQLRILCARELQTSIRDSVHKLSIRSNSRIRLNQLLPNNSKQYQRRKWDGVLLCRASVKRHADQIIRGRGYMLGRGSPNCIEGLLECPGPDNS